MPRVEAVEASGATAVATPSALTLRSAAPTDETFLFDLFVSTRRDDLSRLPLAEPQLDSLLRMQFAARQQQYRNAFPNAEHQVVCLGGERVGCLSVDRGPHELRLIDIALVAQRRGHGLGKSLIESLLTEARESGRTVRLHVEVDNRAVQLYRRLGFAPVSERGIHQEWVWPRGAAGDLPVRTGDPPGEPRQVAGRAGFSDHVHSGFSLHAAPARVVEVELVGVIEGSSTECYEQFSLVFEGPADAPVEQRVYCLEHPALGALELFLVPIGRGRGGGVRYEAVISRLTNTDPRGSDGDV